MPRRHRFQSPALRYLYDRYVGDDPERRAEYEASVAGAKIAMEIYALRTKAALTQAQLAEKVGTSRSVISRLEDADYEGHSLALLRRIAAALGRRVDVRFVELGATRKTGSAMRKRGAA
jgi:DNA-binding XRE family transcriptional regulator